MGFRLARMKNASPPEGWLPFGPTDPVLAAVFDKGWPPSGRRKVKRQQYGLLCPNCTAVLSLVSPQVNEIICHHCGEQIEPSDSTGRECRG